MPANLITGRDYLSKNTDLVARLVSLSGLPETAVTDRLKLAELEDGGAYSAKLDKPVQPPRFGDASFQEVTVIAQPVDEQQWDIRIDAEVLCGTAAAAAPVTAVWNPANKDVLVFTTLPANGTKLPELGQIGELGARNLVDTALGAVTLIPGVPNLAAGDGPPVDALRLALRGGALTSSRAYFTIGRDWEILKGEFKVENLSIGVGRLWQGNKPGSLALGLAGEALIGRHTHLLVSIDVPDVAIRASLNTDKEKPSLKDFFGDFGLDEDFWPDLRIYQLALAYEPALDRHMAFDFEVDGDWEIMPGLSLERMLLHLEQSGSGAEKTRDVRFESSLRFFAGRPAEFTLDLLAEYRPLLPGQTQLLIEGTVAPDKPILLGEMIAELLREVSLTLPQPLHDLAIFDFDLSLEILEQQQTVEVEGATKTLKLSDRRLSVGFTVGSAKGNWVIVPGLLEIAPARIDFVGGTTAGVRIRDTLVLFGADWAIDVQIPSLIGSVVLQGELSLAAALDHFHVDGHGFEDLKLVDATMQFDAGARSVMMHLELKDLWKYHGFELEDVQLGIGYHGGEHGGVEAEFSGVAKIERNDPHAPIEIRVQAVHAGPGLGWRMEGSIAVPETDRLTVLEVGEHFHIGEHLKGLGSLAEIGISHLGVRYDTHTKSFAADCTIGLSSTAEVQLAVERRPAEVTAEQAKLGKNDKIPFEVRFSGVLKAGGLEFDLLFLRDGSGDKLVGAYVNRGGGALSLATLVEAIGGGAADSLTGVSLPLKSAMVARSAPSKEPAAKMLLAADMDVGIDLSGLGHLPLVGSAFSDQNRVTLGFTPMYASAAFTNEELGKIHSIAPPGSPLLPDKLEPGLTLATTMLLGTHRIHVDLPGLGGKKQKGDLDPKLGSPVPRQLKGRNQPPSVCPIPSSASLNWIPVNRQLAKVLHLRQVGVGMHGKEIVIGFDGAITVGPLTLDLMGLGARYGLDDHGLSFALQGLGFEVKTSSLEIGASFANLDGDFVGRAALHLSDFGLTALGAFTMLDGHPSMFIYGVLNAPLGGPVFFFVEGLAAGFGFNRQLTMPPIEEVHTFPFVAEAIGMVGTTPGAPGSLDQSGALSLGEELQKLHRYVYPQTGAIFIAAGLKFNSFRVVDVFALLAVMLDLERSRVRIGLLGVATLQIPAESPDVIAFVELNVLATVDPNEGTALFQAQLTPLSWLLSPDCHLQGGFAAALWARGEHAGDFVYTLGGYHPHFPVPSHFPRVPRLGFHWNIGSEISIRGELYYALTPVAAMAGGCLSATWQAGDLRAWFTLQADFLIQWKPPRFEALINVEIGASYETVFGTITVSIGAGVALWGPCLRGEKLGGSAHFSYGPVHFSIDFGGERGGLTAIAWGEFQKTFLPAAGAVCAANVAGMVRTLEVEKQTWTVVDPRQFRIEVSTVIPIAELTIAGAPSKAAEWQNFGVAPMDRKEAVRSSVSVNVLHAADGDSVTDEFAIELAPKAFPGAMWGQGFQNPDSPRTVQAAGAVVIRPANIPKPGQTAEIRRCQLGFDPEGNTGTVAARAGMPAPGAEVPRTDRKAIAQAAGEALNRPPAVRAEVLASLGYDATRRATISDRYLGLLRATPRLAGVK